MQASGISFTQQTGGKSARLRPTQAATASAWGVLLWFAAAMAIRFAPDTMFARGTAIACAFAAALPLGWLAVWATRRIASLSPAQVLPGVVIACASAMLCDGIGFTWTSIYGADHPDLVPAAAWLLWGVAIILVIAICQPVAEGG